MTIRTRRVALAALTVLAALAAAGPLASSAVAAQAGFYTAEAGTYKGEGGGTLFVGQEIFQCDYSEEAGPLGAGEEFTLTTSSVAFGDLHAPGDCTVGTGMEGNAVMEVNGCNFQFSAGTGTGPGTAQGTTSIVCPKGKSIVVSNQAFNYLAIPSQQGITTEFTGGSGNVEAYLATQSLKYVYNGTTYTNGQFSTAITLHAYNQQGAAQAFEIIP